MTVKVIMLTTGKSQLHTSSIVYTALMKLTVMELDMSSDFKDKAQRSFGNESLISHHSGSP